MLSPDRPRGILSEADRKYLKGDGSGKTRQALSQRRAAVKERFANAILDFTVIFDHMEPSERAEVYDELGIGDLVLVGEVNEGNAALVAMAGVLYEATVETSVPQKYIFSTGARLIEERRLLPEGSNRQVNMNVDFEWEIVEPDNPQIDEILDELRQGRDVERLQPGEIATLVRYAAKSDELDFNPLLEAAKEERAKEWEAMSSKDDADD